MVLVGNQRVGPIYTPNIGPINEGLISISAMKSNPKSPVTIIKAHDESHDSTTSKKLRPNSGWSISRPQGSILSTSHIMDPSMKDWFQYRPWNLTQTVQLRESRYLTYHTTALLPNSCVSMADGPFRNPKGRSSRYCTHRCRIDINIGHEI